MSVYREFIYKKWYRIIIIVIRKKEEAWLRAFKSGDLMDRVLPTIKRAMNGSLIWQEPRHESAASAYVCDRNGKLFFSIYHFPAWVGSIFEKGAGGHLAVPIFIDSSGQQSTNRASDGSSSVVREKLYDDIINPISIENRVTGACHIMFYSEH